MYNFKHINIPSDAHFDDDHLAFLETLDKGLVSAAEKGDKKYTELKEQLKHAFLKIEEKESGSYSPSDERKHSKEERELNNKWIRNFLQKKPTEAIEHELKEFETKDFSNYIDTTETGSAGGYLIPELLLAEIQHVAEINGIARREFRYLPFNGPGNTRKIPTEASGVTVEWISEGEAKPVSNISLSQVTQSLEKLAAISVMTEEVIEDSATDLVSYVSRRLGEEISTEEDNQFFSGVGSPWTGIINNGSIVPVSMEAGETLDDLSPDHLLDMIYAVPQKYRRGAKFYMSSDCMLKLLQYRSSSVASGDDEGQYLVITPMQAEPTKFWGYPVVITDALPDSDSADEADTPFLIFGNLSRCAVYGDKKGLRVKILDQATIENDEGDTFNLAQVDAQAIRVHKRVGYVLTLPEGISVLQTGPTS